MESSYFEVYSRAQIGTSRSKSDVYFAVMKRDFKKWMKGDRIVVKGPYINSFGCEHSYAMAQWKKQLKLPYIENIECIELIPDLWLNVKGLGISYNKIKTHTKYPFMISDDLLSHINLPIKDKEATKAWKRRLLLILVIRN